MNKIQPVQALIYIGSDEARLATKWDPIVTRIANKDCDFVIVGDWMNPNRYNYEVYNRFNLADPFRYPAAGITGRRKSFKRFASKIFPEMLRFKQSIKALN